MKQKELDEKAVKNNANDQDYYWKSGGRHKAKNRYKKKPEKKRKYNKNYVHEVTSKEEEQKRLDWKEKERLRGRNGKRTPRFRRRRRRLRRRRPRTSRNCYTSHGTPRRRCSHNVTRHKFCIIG